MSRPHSARRHAVAFALYTTGALAGGVAAASIVACAMGLVPDAVAGGALVFAIAAALACLAFHCPLSTSLSTRSMLDAGISASGGELRCSPMARHLDMKLMLHGPAAPNSRRHSSIRGDERPSLWPAYRDLTSTRRAHMTAMPDLLLRDGTGLPYRRPSWLDALSRTEAPMGATGRARPRRAGMIEPATPHPLSRVIAAPIRKEIDHA